MFIPQVISWAIIALATSYEMLICGMSTLGFGIGMGFCASTYISEISSASHRGALLGLIPVAYNAGAALTNTLMYYVTWRTSAWIFTTLSGFSLLSTFLLPESPIWLYSKGRKETSIQTLCSLRCAKEIEIQHEIDDMEKANENKTKLTFSATVKKILFAWKPFLIVAVLQCLMQHTGYAILFSYTILIFNRLRLPIDSSKFAIWYAMVGTMGAMAAPYVMHRMNRRTLLTTFSCIMGVCMVIICLYEEIFYHRDEKLFPHIVSLSFYVYVVACNAGVLLIAYSVGSEVFPNEVRGTMNGLYGVASFVYWSFSMKLYPTLINIFHIKIILWSFAGFCFVIATYSRFILPETKGMTLNEVQETYFKKTNKQSVEKENA